MIARVVFALTVLAPALAAQSADSVFVRVNQLGYRPDAPKFAVVCALRPSAVSRFAVEDSAGRRILGPRAAKVAGAFGPCAETYRLDFSSVREPGKYRIVAGSSRSPLVRIGRDVYNGTADTVLRYLRQQRSGWNPVFNDSLHKYDGIVVDDSVYGGQFMAVSGGWADAADYLQYVTTSATATYMLLQATRDHERAFADSVDARGVAGSNGIPDALDEARHGLEWLLRMFVDENRMYNQLGDDRDHSYFDLPVTDSSDYGWGKGRERPVYPCTGRPQGLFTGKNRSTGKASTAGKYASAFALGAALYRVRDPAFSAKLRDRAERAYSVGKAHPGVCQTAPGRSPYFYEEDNWVDDMELAAAELHALTGDAKYLTDALEYAKQEPYTPWMGADTASHYQWYPWHNNGHYSLWRTGGRAEKAQAAAFYRQGLERVLSRADNGFLAGIPFIWCSANLMVSLATQAGLYRRMTGDTRFREMEQAAIDWLFGANPWGASMVIGLPRDGVWARDPHSVVAKQLGVDLLVGGLLDGPVYRSIFQNLRGIRLHEADEHAAFNTGHIVYHDDLGDYSTNEPIMDGSASLAYLLASLASPK